MPQLSSSLPQRAYRELDVSVIQQSHLDVRDRSSDEDIKGLGTTIEDVGLLSPILVSHDSRKNVYKVVTGGRRLQAAKQAGIQKIPAFIVDDLNDRSTLIMMLLENMQRKDLKPLEEARGMADLRDLFGMRESQIAVSLGKEARFVRERLDLLSLPKFVLEQMDQGKIGVTQAVNLTKLKGNADKQSAIALKTIERNLSGDIVERIVEEELRPRRRHKKIKRKYKIKRQGEVLSEAHTNAKLQQIVLRGEELIRMIDAIPIKRWSPGATAKLSAAVSAIQKSLSRYEKRLNSTES